MKEGQPAHLLRDRADARGGRALAPPGGLPRARLRGAVLPRPDRRAVAAAAARVRGQEARLGRPRAPSISAPRRRRSRRRRRARRRASASRTCCWRCARRSRTTSGRAAVGPADLVTRLPGRRGRRPQPAPGGAAPAQRPGGAEGQARARAEPDAPAGRRRLQAFHAAHPADERFARYAELLHGQAILAEGGTLPDPAAFSQRLAELLVEATGRIAPPRHPSSSRQSRSSTARMIRSRWFHQIHGGSPWLACHIGVMICHSTESR